jgi:hypothetical protein
LRLWATLDGEISMVANLTGLRGKRRQKCRFRNGSSTGGLLPADFVASLADSELNPGGKAYISSRPATPVP